MPEPILEIEGLTKSFGALKATNDVTLDLRPGEIHALIGPNGAGKSTLIKQIVGEIRQDAGTIRFEGRPIDGLDAVARARLGLARTFQVSMVAPEMSALRNVMLAVQARDGRVFRFFRPVSRDAGLRDAAMRHLASVGLAEDRAGLRAADLSHGERRQLEFAIALALAAQGLPARRADGRPRPRRLEAPDRLPRQAPPRGADPARRARHGGGLRAGRPHLGAGLRPGHRHRHRRGSPRATRRSAPPTSGTKHA